MLANPWLLAAAIFGLIGILSDPPKGQQTLPAPEKKPKKEKKPATQVHVHTGADGVKSEGTGEGVKPTGEVLSPPSSKDG